MTLGVLKQSSSERLTRSRLFQLKLSNENLYIITQLLNNKNKYIRINKIAKLINWRLIRQNRSKGNFHTIVRDPSFLRTTKNKYINI